MPEIYLCCHCSHQLSGKGKYCLDCNTADKRKQQDENNKKNNPNFICKFCNKEKEVIVENSQK